LWGRTDSKDLPKMLIANAARWSLLSNINQHEVVKQFCLETEKPDKELKSYLEALLTEAAKVAKDEKDKQAAEKQSVAKNETTHKGKREHADENGPNDKQMLGAKSNELDGASSNSGASAPAPVSTAPAETKAATSDVNMTSPSTADESKNVTTDAPKAATTDAAGTTTTDAAKAATTDAAGTTTPDAAAKAVSSDGAGTVTTDPTKTVTTGAGAGASPNASPTPSSPADSSKN